MCATVEVEKHTKLLKVASAQNGLIFKAHAMEVAGMATIPTVLPCCSYRFLSHILSSLRLVSLSSRQA